MCSRGKRLRAGVRFGLAAAAPLCLPAPSFHSVSLSLFLFLPPAPSPPHSFHTRHNFWPAELGSSLSLYFSVKEQPESALSCIMHNYNELWKHSCSHHSQMWVRFCMHTCGKRAFMSVWLIVCVLLQLGSTVCIVSLGVFTPELFGSVK